jgi:dihydroorotate dehydrogenase electron transfer subunit
MKGRIIGTARIGPGSPPVVDMRVEIDLNEPAPGKFVHIAAPGVFLRRPISLCGYENGTARLIFAVKGSGTAALAELQADADMMGALGNGFPPPSPLSGRTLLVGGGIGLPPLLYYAGTYDSTHTIAGFRSESHVMLADEFPSAELCFGEDYPHIRLEKRLESEKDTIAQVLACGPYPLLKAVAGVCAKYNTPCFVSMEERMACGVGACLVCACAVGGGYLRCCKDGPVFDAAQVRWEGGGS